MEQKTVLGNQKPNFSKLRTFGFSEENGTYTYVTDIYEAQFSLTVTIAPNGALKTSLSDKLTNEPYSLHLILEATGEFVGRVRSEYERVLSEIVGQCFEKEVFKSEYAQRLIGYVRERYGRELEYLWEKFPDNAVWRRSDNAKWFAALLTVERKKLGLQGEGKTEILDLRIAPEDIPRVVDNERYFPGYHMNKRHWITVLLDGSVCFGEICERLEESFALAKK